ncbi:hypothetical protein [Paenibacillus sp. FSL H8-0034]|uniref:hypothetical protein n=1 Tax=Paenibacillus sp. FSL H8-0034 TaxID=2954671 RepID=UPI0030F5222B
MTEHLHEVSIDTLFLVAKLTKEELEEIKDQVRFNRNWNYNSSFKYILVNIEPSYRVYIEPKFGTRLYTNSSYNIMIHLHKDAIKAKPALITLLLKIGNWKVKVMHVAYDWNIAFSRHFIYKSDNVKMERHKGRNPSYYLYSKKTNPCIAFVYDKKNQLLESKNINIAEKHLTRFEIRIRPRHKNAPYNDLAWVKSYMDKFTFIPDCEIVTRALAKSHDKESFEIVRRRKGMNWKGVSKRSKEKIRDLCKVAAINFYGLFEQHSLKSNLF